MKRYLRYLAVLAAVVLLLPTMALASEDDPEPEGGIGIGIGIGISKDHDQVVHIRIIPSHCIHSIAVGLVMILISYPVNGYLLRWHLLPL